MMKALPDLALCADEPIRIPGAIQPHGRMLVLDAADGRLVAHSENWPGSEAADAAAASVALDVGSLVQGESPASVGTVLLDGLRMDVSAHLSGSNVVLEFEAASPSRGMRAPMYSLARHFLPQLQDAGSVGELCEMAASEMKRLTGFGRCLAYRFDEDDHGQVIAEALDPGYDAYANHRFPASDIPAQARELYLLNHIRLIPDATYSPVALVGTDAAWRAQSLDLSYAGLRSVSPIHLEYMRNMGTLASMSVSIVVRGRLWGLISCHNHGPLHVPFDVRAACEHLGRLLSMQIAAREDNDEVASRLELRQLMLQIVSNLADSDATLQRLAQEPGPLLRIARASGAAIVLNDHCWTVGDTPPDASITALAQWVADKGVEVYASAQLARERPELSGGLGQRCAGVLALSISQVHRHVILWFRPEIVQTIRWAGRPGKEEMSADGRIHPRHSFESWTEEVTGRSLAWHPSEVTAAVELRQALIGIVLRRAEEMAEVATELGRVNKELEAFSYTVSHDLRAPMRHIAGYVDLVLDMEGKALSERAHRYLAHVKEASSFAVQLVDALLDFSRMGRAALHKSEVDMPTLVDDLIREMGQVEGGRAIEWHVERPLPRVLADPFLLQVVLRNLLSNAVKYSRGRDPAVITVRGVRHAADTGLEVEDNGVGFQMKYAGKLFGVFQRLHQAEEFEGTGIGLANVRRVVERHGGAVWARGEPGRGAAFGFTLPTQPESA